MDNIIEKLDKAGYDFGEFVCTARSHTEKRCESCRPVMPDLEELIERCGERFSCLRRHDAGWSAYEMDVEGEDVSHTRHAPDSKTAVAEMWISLNTKYE